MNLRYKKMHGGYAINKNDIFYYKFFYQFKTNSSLGYYKNRWFGINYFEILKDVRNYPLGIKIKL